MIQDFWKNKLTPFVSKHPYFEGVDPIEEIFTPKKGLKIRFWFEGGIQIEGEYNQLEINYNSPDILILAQRNEVIENIFRIPWVRLISFELIIGNEADQKIKDLVRLN